MGSPFASRHTTTVSLPTDPTESITIRKLAGGVLERAQAVHLADTVAGRSPRGWAGIFQRALEAGIATNADALKLLQDPLSGYDRYTLVKGGVTAWTYQDEGKPKPVSAETVADLDDEAMEFLAVAIMKLTKPALFMTAEEAEADQKNDSRAFIGH